MIMRRVAPLLLLAVVAACGGRGADIAHPSGHDDVVVRIATSPGAGPSGLAFSTVPQLVLTGDGTAYIAMQEATMTGIVSPVVKVNAPDDALPDLLARADRDRLLGEPPDYSPPEPVLDADDLTVVLAADGHTWTHTASALGDTATNTAARDRLADFVDYADSWSLNVHTDDAQQDYAPSLRVMATPTPETADLPGPVAAWPSAAQVRLADIGPCTVVDDPVVVRSLTTRDERFYREGRLTYSVAAAVSLPGDSCSDQAHS